MKTFIKHIAPVAMMLLLFAACSKKDNAPAFHINGSRHLTLSDSDSTYIAHIQIDSSRHDSLRNFTVYCFITTKHGSSRLTVPGNFTVTSTVFYGTPIQTVGTDTIYAGHNYGSHAFSTTTTYPLTFTNSTPSPTSFGGVPIIVQHDPGVFTP